MPQCSLPKIAQVENAAAGRSCTEWANDHNICPEAPVGSLHKYNPRDGVVPAMTSLTVAYERNEDPR
jgi:hypothetical protein